MDDVGERCDNAIEHNEFTALDTVILLGPTDVRDMTILSIGIL